MRKLLVTGMALGLSACASGGVVGPSDNGGIAKVQGAAVQICKFLPAAKVVADILLTSNMIAVTAESVAQKICDAVTNRPLADGPGDRVPRVNGIVVRGKFVK